MRRRIPNCAVCGRPRADHALVELQTGCRQAPIVGWPLGGFAAAAAASIELEQHILQVIDASPVELAERDQIALALDITTALLPVAFHDEARR